MTTETIPIIQIVANTETIASCGACGQDNYRRAKRGDSHRALFMPRPEVQLWDLRICPNGAQTYVTKLCTKCLAAVHEGSGLIVRGEQSDVSFRK